MTNPEISNIPPEVLKAIREQERERTKEGILGGLVGEERSKPKPEPAKHVSDIRSGHGYT